MNREEEIKRWQASIDDDLLEEAQRPLPRSGAGKLMWRLVQEQENARLATARSAAEGDGSRH